MRSFRFVVTAFSAIALVALLAGCGKSTSPTAVTPDSTPPTAPTGLAFGMDGSGAPTLSWAPDPGGSVSSYLVFVYDPTPTRDMSYTQIGQTATTSFAIPAAYQAGVHFYKVQAVNSGGNSSPYSSMLLVSFPSGSSTGGGGGGGGGRPHIG